MSNQCGFPICDINPCNDMEAWWTMITSVYNFLSASTSLAQTLDKKYANRPADMRSPLLIKNSSENTKNTNIVLPEDFPWFLQLLSADDELPEASPNRDIISDEQVLYYCDIRPEIFPGMVEQSETKAVADVSHQDQLSTPMLAQEVDGGIDIERALRSMHTLEQSIIQCFMDDEEKALLKLSEQNDYVSIENQELPTEDNVEGLNLKNSHEDFPGNETVITKEETMEGYTSEDSCYFHEFSDSEQTIDSVNLSTCESQENSDRIATPSVPKSFVDNEKHSRKLVEIKTGGTEEPTTEEISTCVEKETLHMKKAIPNNSIHVSVYGQNSKIEQNSCPKCHKPSKCKHDKFTENISCGRNSKSGEDPIKLSSSDNKHCKHIPETTRKLAKKNYSDIVPRNIGELKEQLNAISKSKLCKNATKTISKNNAENKRLPEDTNKLKNTNFTVFTAKVSYRGQQKSDIAAKNSRASNRFASVESVVKKLIAGDKIAGHKVSVTPKIPVVKKAKTKLKNTEGTIKPHGERSTAGRAPVEENKIVDQPLQICSRSENSARVSPEVTEGVVHVLDEKAIRNRYTISNQLRTQNPPQLGSENTKKIPINRTRVGSGTLQQNTSTSNDDSIQRENSKAEKRPSSKKSPTCKNKK